MEEEYKRRIKSNAYEIAYSMDSVNKFHIEGSERNEEYYISLIKSLSEKYSKSEIQVIFDLDDQIRLYNLNDVIMATGEFDLYTKAVETIFDEKFKFLKKDATTMYNEALDSFNNSFKKEL